MAKFFKKEKVGMNLTEKQSKNIELLMNKHNMSRRDIMRYVQEFDLNID